MLQLLKILDSALLNLRKPALRASGTVLKVLQLFLKATNLLFRLLELFNQALRSPHSTVCILARRRGCLPLPIPSKLLRPHH